MLLILSKPEINGRLGVALYYEYSTRQGVVILFSFISLIFEVVMAFSISHFIKKVFKGVMAAILSHKLIKLFALPNLSQLLITLILY